ncbi:acetyltransferase [Shewanella algae]|uniref:acetyltransferase n=1 Tax=Shewanella algae TaxID=38313 RepID=UPI003186F10F
MGSEKVEQLVIFGCSSFTKSVISLCKKINSLEVVAICVDDEYLDFVSEYFYDTKVVSFTVAKESYPNALYFPAIGYKSMRQRESVFNKLRRNGLKIASVVSPNANVSTNKIGSGCIIFDGVVIEQGAIIHDNVTVWSNVTICHDVEINSHCFIAANSTIGGFVEIGARTFIGFSCTLIDSIKVGDECLVGAGSLVNKSIEGLSKCYGNPVRIIERINPELGVCLV